MVAPPLNGFLHVFELVRPRGVFSEFTAAPTRADATSVFDSAPSLADGVPGFSGMG